MVSKYLSLTLLISTVMLPFALQAQTQTVGQNTQTTRPIQPGQTTTQPGSSPSTPTVTLNSALASNTPFNAGSSATTSTLTSGDTSSAVNAMNTPSEQPSAGATDGNTNAPAAPDTATTSPDTGTVSTAATSTDGSTIIASSTTPSTSGSTSADTTQPLGGTASTASLSALSTPTAQLPDTDQNEFGSVGTSGGIGYGAASVTTGTGYNM